MFAPNLHAFRIAQYTVKWRGLGQSPGDRCIAYQEIGDFFSRQPGDIVDVQVALVAEASTLVTSHLLPVGGTGGSDSQAIDSVSTLHFIPH